MILQCAIVHGFDSVQLQCSSVAVLSFRILTFVPHCVVTLMLKYLRFKPLPTVAYFTALEGSLIQTTD